MRDLSAPAAAAAAATVSDSFPSDSIRRRRHHRRRFRHSSPSVETRNRHLLLIFSAVSTCFFVGAALGWGPMQLMLEENGAFSGECDNDDDTNTATDVNGDGTDTITTTTICADQTAILVKNGLLIPVAQIVSPLLGLFVDRFGPKRAAVAQGTCLLVGLVVILFAVSVTNDHTANTTDPLLFVGFGLVALHTWFGRLLIIQLGLYFTGHDISRVIFVLNSLFDAGAVTYLALWGIKQATRTSTPAILGGYFFLACLITLGYVCFWTIAKPQNRTKATVDLSESASDHSGQFGIEPPKANEHIETETEPILDPSMNNSDPYIIEPLEASENEEIENKKEKVGVVLTNKVSFISTSEDSERDEKDHIENDSSRHEKQVANSDSSGEYVLIAERSRRRQLTSKPFLLLCALFGLNVMSNNWNIMTQRAFLAGLGDDEHGHIYLTLFVLMTPVLILGAPLIDKVILRFGWMAGFQTINLLGFGYTLIKVASTNLNVQILGFVIFSFYRSFLFGLTFSFLPTFVAGSLVGTAAGTIAGFGGCATLLTIPLVNVAVKRNDGDFIISNLIMLSLVFPAILLVCYLKKHMIIEHQAKKPQGEIVQPRKDTTVSLSFTEKLTEKVVAGVVITKVEKVVGDIVIIEVEV